jgi:hypothetical protein
MVMSGWGLGILGVKGGGGGSLGIGCGHRVILLTRPCIPYVPLLAWNERNRRNGHKECRAVSVDCLAYVPLLAWQRQSKPYVPFPTCRCLFGLWRGSHLDVWPELVI